jgi:hypothetical protein
MHGLAAYENGVFRGYVPYSKVPEIPGAEVIYRQENHKPLFVKINPDQNHGH